MFFVSKSLKFERKGEVLSIAIFAECCFVLGRPPPKFAPGIHYINQKISSIRTKFQEKILKNSLTLPDFFG